MTNDVPPLIPYPLNTDTLMVLISAYARNLCWNAVRPDKKDPIEDTEQPLREYIDALFAELVRLQAVEAATP